MNNGHLLQSMLDVAAELIGNLVTQTEVNLDYHISVVLLRYTLLNKIARADTKYKGKLQLLPPHVGMLKRYSPPEG